MISIITPTHNPKYLDKVYQSLKNQTYKDWEWIILYNGDCLIKTFDDHRVKHEIFKDEVKGVGQLKKEACKYATKKYILELDHDDYLEPTALEKVVKAFEEDKNRVLVYSNCISLRPDNTCIIWDERYGWKYRDFKYKELITKEAISPLPYPSNISKIWYAPNHLRAWRRDVYEKIGGHNEEYNICDDHELLCRLYLEGDFYLIDECLYIYNVHGNNTWLKYIKEIEILMWKNYFLYFEDMAMAWSKRNNLKCIDLCGGIDKPEGYISIDKENGDIKADLNEDWPLAENSVGLIRANDAIEHLKNPIHTMNEAHRVLAHGGVFLIDVPSTDGQGAFCDPTHVSFWNKRSFRYYTESQMKKYLEPNCNCRFQISFLENIKKYDDLPYVRAHLIAIKSDKNEDRIFGEKLI